MTIAGYKVNNIKLNHWNLLLREWIHCFEQMCDYSGTTPYWNCKEDSNSGPFVGAIWRLGWTAFPEIKCKRTSLGGYGEVDFYIACPPLGISEYIESKGSKISIANHATTCLSTATQHASTIKDGTIPLKLGIGFCNVEIRTENNDTVTELTQQLLAEVRREVKCDAIGWCFPLCVRTYEEDPGVFSPGVILLANIAN